MTLADLGAALPQGLCRVVLTVVMALSCKQGELDLDAHRCEGAALRKGLFESRKKTGKRHRWVNTIFLLSGIGQAARTVFSLRSSSLWCCSP